MSVHENILTSSAQIYALLKEVKIVAVVGIKTEEKSDQPAFYVPQFLQSAGLEIVPVPVYYPDATEILGRKVYRKLMEIPGEIDVVNLFRRPADIPFHVEDILEKKPTAVWMQSGIAHDEAALQLAQAGIQVVQNRCLMVEYKRFLSKPEA